MLRICLRFCSVLLLCSAAFGAHPAFAQYNAFEDPQGGNNSSSAASTQEFGPAKPDVEGGDIPPGQTNQVIVLLRNNSNAPIAAEKINLVPSSNVTATIASDQCGKDPVKPGIECAITVSIKGEAAGKYRVGMLINHSGRSKISSIGIVGNISGSASSGGGQPANEIDAFPKTLDFGTAKGRVPAVRSISLRNASTKTIDIQAIELAASPLTGFSVSAPDCKVLEASQSCVATVTWTPTATGQAQGVLVLRHSGPSGSLQVPLTGVYDQAKTEKAELFPSAVSGQGLVIADRDAVDFGSAVDGAASITVSLVNMGDKKVTLKQVKLAGSDNGLSLSSEGCAAGKILEPNDGCALTVNWQARRAGPVIDDIQVTHDGARGVLVLPVRGTATQSVSLNMPLNATTLPKIGNKELDETLLKAGGKATPPAAGNDVALSANSAALNGYRVTSLSSNSAVIAGPRGRMVVEEGKAQVIAGGHWLPHIVGEGVELKGDKDTVLLVFDPTLVLTESKDLSSKKEFPASSGEVKSGLSSFSDSSSSSSRGSGSSGGNDNNGGRPSSNGMNSGGGVMMSP